MRVYRIENPSTKTGPYNDGEYYRADREDLREALHRTQWSERHPNPFEDGIEDFRRGVHRCAFSSLEALREWFDAETLRLLEKHGFVLRVLYVKDDAVLAGKHQVVYDPECMTRVWRRYPPTAALTPEAIA